MESSVDGDIRLSVGIDTKKPKVVCQVLESLCRTSSKRLKKAQGIYRQSLIPSIMQ